MKTLLAVMTLSVAVVFMTLAAAAAPPKFAPQIAHVSQAQVAAAVKKAALPKEPPVPLIPRDMDLGVRVNVGRKLPGARAEVHSIYGHVFYVQEGEGTLVLGGELVDPKEGVPGEWTGSSTRGGKEFRMKKGDMITVQVGMPHYWKDMPDTGIVFIAFHAYPEHNQPGAAPR